MPIGSGSLADLARIRVEDPVRLRQSIRVMIETKAHASWLCLYA